MVRFTGAVTATLVSVLSLLNAPAARAQQAAGTTAPTCRFMDECFAEWSCRLPPGVPKLIATATLAEGRSITGDGKGTYVEGRDSSIANVRAALNVHATSPTAAAANARRFFTIDLSHPADSTAVPLGIIKDPFADFHAWGATLARRGVEPTIQYLPVSTTVKSALVHIDFTLADRFYMLQFGREALGDGCNAGGTALYGTGTTAATVSRPRSNRYVVDAPAGSIARLFDVTNKLAGAVNKGLYYASVRAQFDIHEP